MRGRFAGMCSFTTTCCLQNQIKAYQHRIQIQDSSSNFSNLWAVAVPLQNRKTGSSRAKCLFKPWRKEIETRKGYLCPFAFWSPRCSNVESLYHSLWITIILKIFHVFSQLSIALAKHILGRDAWWFFDCYFVVVRLAATSPGLFLSKFEQAWC